jgi:hypothetical protein
MVQEHRNVDLPSAPWTYVHIPSGPISPSGMFLVCIVVMGSLSANPTEKRPIQCVVDENLPGKED